MNESSLFKIALTVSLTGILILLLIVEYTDIKKVNISDIENMKEEEKIRVIGKINNVKETPGLYILDLQDDSGKISVIVFKEEKLNISKGYKADIEGTVKEYQNKKELIANKIAIV
ncbi:OB-fold nucleic acid binding domain-containing protein [Candidatus Woesearchaeota archaeon]|nr:OB-fold nucleic acid binding domain-containing protein [Candidatus Woesearchaeota archaeon]